MAGMSDAGAELLVQELLSMGQQEAWDSVRILVGIISSSYSTSTVLVV